VRRLSAGAHEPSPIIIGQSFGSLIALELARECASVGSPVRGVGMMNCGVGMNNKNALKVEGWRARQAAKGIDVEPAAEGWQLAFIGAVLALVDAIFNMRWLLTLILDKFATADNVRSALQRSVYVNPECVTDDLVDDYLSLATDKEAAVEVLRQIYTNDGGPLPFDAADALPDDLPILVVWGDTDNLAPITGPVGRYFRQRAQALPATRFEEIHAGHVPQDDSPEQTNAILREWLAAV
jgi:pimeloyl-ACP methyl ester carboxylesterase